MQLSYFCPENGKRLFFTVLSLLLVGCFQDSPSEDASQQEFYSQSLRGSIFGSVSEKDIEDALPDAIRQKDLVPQFVERGRYLTVVAACGSCHGGANGDPKSPLIGGKKIHDRFGEVAAANLTPVAENGIGDWTLREIGSAIRSSLGPDAHTLSLDVHSAYRWMADVDVLAVASYLKGLRPIKNEVERREMGTFERNSLGVVSRHQPIFGYVPSPATNNPKEYGRYLVHHVTACVSCHTGEGSFFKDGEILAGREASDDPSEFPQGGPDIRGKSVTGLKSWKARDIVNYLESGVNIQGKKVSGALCPWPFFQYLTKKDKEAIAEYLKTL